MKYWMYIFIYLNINMKNISICKKYKITKIQNIYFLSSINHIFLFKLYYSIYTSICINICNLVNESDFNLKI